MQHFDFLPRHADETSCLCRECVGCGDVVWDCACKRSARRPISSDLFPPPQSGCGGTRRFGLRHSRLRASTPRPVGKYMPCVGAARQLFVHSAFAPFVRSLEFSAMRTPDARAELPGGPCTAKGCPALHTGEQKWNDVMSTELFHSDRWIGCCGTQSVSQAKWVEANSSAEDGLSLRLSGPPKCLRT